MGLIVAQRDAGVALLTLLIGSTYFAFVRIPWRAWAGMAVLAVAVLAALWSFGLASYQKERILTFFDPERDPRGAGYQVRQSKIAVGSGGFDGKGLYQGTQSQLQFLPAQQTDFVFAVLAEEFGFAGAGGVVGLYFFLTFRCLTAARLARDKLGRYIALGFGTAFGCQTLVNLGMIIGLVPIVGLPLPLMSYGGSSMMATLLGFGLVLNVKMRRFVN